MNTKPLLSLMLALVGFRAAAEPVVTPPGLSVGQRAPDFVLKDQSGQDVSLESLLKKGPVAVVFFRSATWCLYCKVQLLQLQRNLKEITDSGAQVVAISYDAPETIKRFVSTQHITFPVLSDPQSKTIDAYCVRTTEATGKFTGMARHGTFVLDQNGVIRSKFLVFPYEDRAATDSLVQALREAQTLKAGTK
jgi:peroxiredoxin